MSNHVKGIILSIVGLAILLVLIKPDFGLSGFNRKHESFVTTPKAAAALESSVKIGRPVFLKFYAKW